MATVRPNRFRTGDLKSRLLRNAQTSVYQVKLQPPPAVADFLRGNTGFNYSQPIDGGEDVEIRCCEALLPGTSLATHDSKDDYMGITEKMAYRRMYDDTFDILFYVDHQYSVVEMFDGWIDFISGFVDQRGRADSSLSPYTNYRFNYPDDYKAREISVTKFEKDINQKADGESFALDYKFINAFPITITSTPVTYQESDVLRYNVRFSYMKYTRHRQKYNLSWSE